MNSTLRKWDWLDLLIAKLSQSSQHAAQPPIMQSSLDCKQWSCWRGPGQTELDWGSVISEVTCDDWQVLGFIVCICMYGGMYCGTYWYVLTWYVLWHVFVFIMIFGMYSYILVTIGMYKKWYVLYILVSICMYWYLLIYIDLYWMYWYVLVCIDIYWSVIVGIGE